MAALPERRRQRWSLGGYLGQTGQLQMSDEEEGLFWDRRHENSTTRDQSESLDGAIAHHAAFIEPCTMRQSDMSGTFRSASLRDQP